MQAWLAAAVLGTAPSEAVRWPGPVGVGRSIAMWSAVGAAADQANSAAPQNLSYLQLGVVLRNQAKHLNWSKNSNKAMRKEKHLQAPANT